MSARPPSPRRPSSPQRPPSPGFGSSAPRFRAEKGDTKSSMEEQKGKVSGKKHAFLKRKKRYRGRVQQRDWSSAALYIRKTPWPKDYPIPHNALILVEKKIPGDDDDEETEYETFFYNNKGKLIKRLNATISMHNNEDFTSASYQIIKQILAGDERGKYSRSAEGLVSRDELEEVIPEIIETVKKRARAANRERYAIMGGILVGALGILIAILSVSKVIDVPEWFSVLTIGTGFYAAGSKCFSYYFDHKNRCLHKMKLLFCGSNLDCCNSLQKKASGPRKSLASPNHATMALGSKSAELPSNPSDREVRLEIKASSELSALESGQQHSNGLTHLTDSFQDVQQPAPHNEMLFSAHSNQLRPVIIDASKDASKRELDQNLGRHRTPSPSPSLPLSQERRRSTLLSPKRLTYPNAVHEPSPNAPGQKSEGRRYSSSIKIQVS